MPNAENDAEQTLRAEGYAAAIADVLEAINESLNLAHLREALRYLKPRPIPPGSTEGGAR